VSSTRGTHLQDPAIGWVPHVMHISEFPEPTHLTDLVLDARITREDALPAFVRDASLRPFSESMARSEDCFCRSGRFCRLRPFFHT
jgi:hypothetical protein